MLYKAVMQTGVRRRQAGVRMRQAGVRIRQAGVSRRQAGDRRRQAGVRTRQEGVRLREVIPPKKPLTFGHFPKGGGGGPTQIQKFLGSFFWAFFWTFSIKRGGVNPFQKFWGSL